MGLPTIGSFTTQPSGLSVPVGPDVVQHADEGGGGGGGRLLLDNFVEAIDTTINLHTPDEDSVGNGWGSGGGDPMTSEADTNDLHGLTNETAIIDVGVTAKDMGMTIREVGGDYLCVCWRIVDNANWIGLLGDDGGYWVYKEIGGSLAEVDGTKINWTLPTDVIRVTVNAAGDYNTYLNDVWKNSGTVNELIGNTNVGYFVYSSGGTGEKFVQYVDTYELGNRP